MNKEKLLKPLLLIVAIILFCSVLSRLFAGSETLLEYAEENPEIAYPSREPEQASKDIILDNGTAAGNASGTNLPPGEKESHTPSPGAEAGIVPEAENGSAAEASGSALKTEAGSAAEAGIGTAPESEVQQESENLSMNADTERIIYKDGFYYEPLSDEMIQRITGISYPAVEENLDASSTKAVNIAASAEDIRISYDQLCYMSVLHYNFHGVERTGELICNKAIAQDLIEIFYELYQNEYQIEQIRLIDEYNGDDTLSMQDNNTSCFNYRVVDGTSSLSKHALGLAIDINPFFNPYVVFRKDGTTYISPQGSETYADRSQDFAYKIDENDLCYQLFREHGFIWGGHWNSCKDYQHFQKVPE